MMNRSIYELVCDRMAGQASRRADRAPGRAGPVRTLLGGEDSPADFVLTDCLLLSFGPRLVRCRPFQQCLGLPAQELKRQLSAPRTVHSGSLRRRLLDVAHGLGEPF